MKVMKKILAIFLVFIMTFSVLPTASAQSIIDNANAIENSNDIEYANVDSNPASSIVSSIIETAHTGWLYNFVHRIVAFFSDIFKFKCPLCDDGLHGKDEDTGITMYRKVTFAYPSSLDASETEGFEMSKSEMVKDGTLVYALKIPETPGYIFGGWSYDDANTQLASTEDTITKDITLYPYLIESTETSEEFELTPNFSAVIDADAATYAVIVKADSEESIKEFLFIADIGSGNVQREPVITANGDGTYKVVPLGGFIPGGTYQFNALDRLDESVSSDNYIQFVENGSVLGKKVQFYNVTIHKDEFDNVRLDEDIIFVSVDDVNGFSFDDTALFTASVNDGEVNAKKNNATGSFEYNGEKALKVGNIIAVHTGKYSEEEHSVPEKENVSYVRITKIEGTTCYYEIPGAEEVMFMPEMFPVDKNALGVKMSEDKTTLTVPEKLLQIEGASFKEEGGLGADFTADVGDFIAYAGKDTSEKSEYYEILTITQSEDNLTFTIKPITEEYIESSADMYVEKSIAIELTDEEIKGIEQKIKENFDGETYGTMAANYVSSLLEVGGAEELFPGLDTEGMEFTVTNSKDEKVTLAPDELKDFAEAEAQLGTQGVEAGAGAYSFNVKFGKVDVEPEVSMGSKNLENITSLKNGLVGMRAAISVYVPLEIQIVLIGATTQNSGSWNTVMSSLDLDLTASFEFEFGLDASLDFDTQWKKDYVWIIPYWYIYDYVIKASLDVGLYTGAGAVFTMNTGAYEDAYDFDNFLSAFDSTYQPGQIEIGNLSKTLEKMMNEPYEFFGSETGERSLWDDYKDMLEIETEYFDLLPVIPEIMAKKRFYLDSLHILQMEISANIIISASANINVGMSFEHLDAKRYSVTFGLKRNNRSNNVTNLQDNFTNFNFYCMGQIGLRVGVRVSAGIGILSVKTNNITFTVEGGPYLKLHGFFYVHYDIDSNNVKTIYHGGLYHVDIGLYCILELSGDILGLVGFYVQFMEEEWSEVTIGSEDNIVGMTKARETKNTSPQKASNGKYEIPISFTPKLRSANLLTGNTYDVEKKPSDFNISVISNDVKLKRTDSNTIYLEPIKEFTAETLELSAEIRVTYKKQTMPMSTNPIVMFIDYHWKKSEPKYRITFEVGNVNPDMNGEFYEHPNLAEEQLSEEVCLEGKRYSELKIPSFTPPAGFYWKNEWARINGVWVGDEFTTVREIIDFENDIVGVDEGEGFVDNNEITVRPVLYLKKDIQYKIRHMVPTEESGYKDYELYREDTYNDGFVGMNEFIYVGGWALPFLNQCNVLLTDYAIDIEGYRMDKYKSADFFNVDEYTEGEFPYAVNPDGSTVLVIYYEKYRYSTYLSSNIDDMYKYTPDGKSFYLQEVPYGRAPDGTMFEETVVVPGYTFKGWREYTYTKDGKVYGDFYETLPVIEDDSGNSKYFYYEAYYEPNKNTEYTVVVSVRQLTLDYLPVSIKTYTGTTDQPIDYQTALNDALAEYPEEFECATLNPYYLLKNGYTVYDLEKATIDGDGTAVFEIQFERKYYAVEWLTEVKENEYSTTFETFDYDWFYVGQEIDVTGKVPPNIPEGYEFGYWKGYTEGMTMPDEGVKFYPAYVPAEGTEFTVKHVKADEYGRYNHEDASLIETETVYGKTEQPAVNYVTFKDYTGFEAGNASSTLTINGDGSTVLTVTYARKTYPVNLVLDPENIYEYESFTQSYKPITEYTYGTTLKLPDDSGVTYFKNPGYLFAGWYLASDETKTVVEYVDTTACTELTYYAKWIPIPTAYLVEHYYQNAVGSFDVEPVVETFYAMYGDNISAEPIVKEGYTFDESNPNNVLEVKMTTSRDYATVLKVYYTKNEYAIPYTVEHYLQEADGTYPAETEIVQFFTASLNETVNAKALPYKGFSEDTTNADAVKSATITSFDDEVILKVYYSRNVYTAKFTDYDDTVLGTDEFAYGETIKVPETIATPTRPGYTFVAWQALGNMDDADITVSAKDAEWNAHTYTVEFNANGGQNTMGSQSFVYDAEQALSRNLFTYANHNFMGWSTTANGAVEYKDTASVSNLTAEDGGKVVLYAVWELVEGATANYTVEYYMQGVDGKYGAVADSSETKVGIIEETVTISKDNSPSFEGFTFDTTQNDALSAAVNEDGSTVLKAYYSRNIYSLTINYGADQIKMYYWDETADELVVGSKATNPEYAETELEKTISAIYGGSIADALADITLADETGYRFGGWYVDETAVDETTVMPASNVTVTAKWNPVDVIFTVDPCDFWDWNGIDVTIENNTFTVKYGDIIEAPFVDATAFTGVPEGYVILGWQGNAGLGQGVSLPFPCTVVEGYDGNFSIYDDIIDEEGNYCFTISPLWVDEYDILHFEGNGGIGAMSDMYLNERYYQRIPQNAFSRDGFEFVGWSTDPNAVPDNDNYYIYNSWDGIYGNSNSGEIITLYAIWREIPVE